MGLFPWQTETQGNRAEDVGERSEKKVALIMGVTGIVGNYLASLLSKPDAPGGPWKIYGTARRPKPEWLSKVAPGLEYVQCDLLDREQTLSKLSALQDVTHMFWVTWVARDSEAANTRDNAQILQNSVDALLSNAKNLQHIVLQTGGKQYMGSFESFGKVKARDAPFVEDVPRLPIDLFYHAQEDIVFETAKKTLNRVSYSIHRPTMIFGFAAGNMMNIVGAVAVYAVICKYEGMVLAWTGNEFTYDRLFDTSDAELIAEQEIWACVDPRAKIQAFNTSNGDVFKWKRLWQLLAEWYGLTVPEPNFQEPIASMEELMKGKEGVWEKIVKEHGLEPVKLEDIGQWWFADMILNQVVDNVSSMNKCRRFGYLGWRDTEKSFLDVLDKMKEHNLLP